MKGQIVSDKYDRIGNFHQGYASVCLNKLWGAIDLQNRVVVPLAWQGVAPIVDPKLIWVKKDNLYYLYDGVQKSCSSEAGDLPMRPTFDNEMAYVMSDGKWGDYLIRMARYWCLACSRKKRIWSWPNNIC